MGEVLKMGVVLMRFGEGIFVGLLDGAEGEEGAGFGEVSGEGFEN